MISSVLLLTQYSGSLAWSQVTTAVTPTTGGGNLGTSVTQAGRTYQITGGTRPANGPNLFHSFGQFSVGQGDTAQFLNTTPAIPTSNILGRVTGGNISSIFGTIDTMSYPGANLFLMNPAGIVFGPNASLNVGGSVSFTTADYLRLADGARFNAIPGPMDASISSAPVAAFGFLGSNPAAITVQGGQLAVAPGQALSLVGGDLTIQGVTMVEEGAVQPVQLSAAGGRLAFASVASPGEILAGTLETAPNVNGQSFGTLGTVQISHKAVLDSSGYDGGTILIRGGRLIVDDSTISANVTGPLVGQPNHTGMGINIQATQDVVIQHLAVLETNVTDQASAGIGSGGVRIRADHIEIAGTPDFETLPFTGIRSNVAPMSHGGKSGDIVLQANSILMKDNSALEAITSSTSDGGNVKVITVQTLETENFGRITTASDGSAGSAGNIELSSTQGDLLLKNAFITSQATLLAASESANGPLGTGNTGNIILNAPNGDILLSQGGSVFNAVDSTTGSLGKIAITARNLTLQEGSRIEGDNLTPQLPNNITLALSERMTLESNSLIITSAWRSAPAADLTVTAPQVLITGGSSLITDTFRSGQGGRLSLFTDSLQLTDGGQLRSGSRPAPFSTDPPVPTGAGGTVVVQSPAGPAQSILVDGVGSGVFTDTQGTGRGGNVNLTAQSVTVQNGGAISASTTGTASGATGGTIAISSVQSTNLNSGGTITASSTGPANAGNITINAGSQFFSNNGRVTTEASQASGGNIVVQATDSIRLVNSRVSTSVEGGPTTAGGNITLDPSVVTLQNSQVLAQANQGQGGNINITAGTFLADQTSLVSASSEFGLSGTVNIQSPVSSLSGTLATLPQQPLQVQNLLSQRCAAQAGGRLSSLVVSGRERLPAEPGGWLMSPMTMIADSDALPPEQPATSLSADPPNQVVVHAGRLSAPPRPLPGHDMSNLAAGCGS
jgi:filamentous hemagglutinin family protein